MIKCFSTLLILAFSCLQATAQRYATQIFDEVTVNTVTYSTEKDLKMDIYQASDDKLESRPVMLFVHGGGFAGGARNEPAIMDFCKNMARRGIVAVSMSYTLVMKGKSFSCDCAAEEKVRTFEHVAKEIAEATRYLIDHQQALKIDAALVTLAGSSAGAEAVLQAAFWDKTYTELPAGFQYAGLISMAGAMYDVNWINEQTAIPMQFFHGTCDDLVPYATAPHHYCDKKDPGYLVLNGPATIVERLQAMNKGYYLVTGCSDNHVWAGRPFKKYRSEIADFIHHDVILKKRRHIHQIITSDRACAIGDLPEVCK